MYEVFVDCFCYQFISVVGFVAMLFAFLELLFIYLQARFLEAAVAYKKKIGFNGTLCFKIINLVIAVVFV